MSVEIRSIAAEELAALLVADERGFGSGPTAPAVATTWAADELDRTRVAFAGGRIVGVSRAYSLELTLPGGARLPTAGVASCSVLPTHRRRGLLAAMLAALHDDARARAEPIAALTASEPTIYGRFGYGPAAWRLACSIDRAHLNLRADAPDGGGSLRMLDPDEIERVLPPLYDRIRGTTPGGVSRPASWWAAGPTGFHAARPGLTVVVHADAEGRDDAYVSYAVGGEWNGGYARRRVLVADLQAATPAARLACWRYLGGIDAAGIVSVAAAPVDDPIRHALVDPRRLRIDSLVDGLWCRPLDPARVLAARRYGAGGSLVIEMADPDGTRSVLALDGGPDGAECRATTAVPDLRTDAATLGAALLGGTRWSELVAAGRATGDPDVVRRADAMFSWWPAPAMLSTF